MSKIYILVLFLFAGTTLVAQKVDQSNSSIEKKVDGHSIFLKPMPNATWLFDILKDGKIVYQLNNNPFTMRPEGFEKKEDAFKIAEWLIKEYKNNKHFPPVIPPHVADQNKIKIQREIKSN